jgi:hypothetical protein
VLPHDNIGPVHVGVEDKRSLSKAAHHGIVLQLEDLIVGFITKEDVPGKPTAPQ